MSYRVLDPATGYLGSIGPSDAEGDAASEGSVDEASRLREWAWSSREARSVVDSRDALRTATRYARQAHAHATRVCEGEAEAMGSAVEAIAHAQSLLDVYGEGVRASELDGTVSPEEGERLRAAGEESLGLVEQAREMLRYDRIPMDLIAERSARAGAVRALELVAEDLERSQGRAALLADLLRRRADQLASAPRGATWGDVLAPGGAAVRAGRGRVPGIVPPRGTRTCA